MKLYSLLNENQVLLGERPESLRQAIEQMVNRVGEGIQPHTFEEVVKSLIEREQTHPTTIVEGVCIPHARLPQLQGFWLLLMVAEEPIAHLSEDQPPVSMIFMILAPQNKNTMMLQTLAAVARLLKSKKSRQQILSVRSPSRLIKLIEESGVDVKRTLIASDVMTPVSHTLTLDVVLAKALDVLVDSPDDGVPVLNARGELAGELTSMELINLGMPKYVGILVNPSMLEHFEPFENFFRHENNMTVGEICRRDFLAVEPSTPVVNVTHQMVTNRRRRIYVIEDGKPVGVIYRKNIVTRVLHF